jgi:serine/threonine-protein kinase
VYQASRLARYRSEDKLCVKLGAEAVAAYERAYGAESLETSMAYMNLGSCLGRAGDPEQGIGHFERALAIRRKLVGEDHPLVADALLTLGVAQKNLGRKQEALASYQQALAIRERVYGPDNTDVAAVRNNIANVLKDLGRYDEAMAHVTRAVAIWEGKWGPDSPAVAVGHSVMGHIEMDRGRFAEAEPHYRRALAIRQKRRPPGHPDITSSMMNVGWSLVKQGKKEGVPLLEEALARTKADEDSGPADLAEVTFLIGQALVTLRLDVKKGRALLEESCGVFAATKGWEDEAAECRTVLRSLEGD